MGTITISLSDEVERKLREIAKAKFGASKGAISKVIESALKNYFSQLEMEKVVFRAYKGKELIAEAKSLDDLARTLREKGVDPRNVKIVSTKQLKPVVRRGWR